MGDKQKNCIENYPDILNPKMIAEIMGIGYVKALALVKSGALPCIRLGNAYKVPKSSFLAWLEEPGLRKVI